ncbi:oriE replication initiation protein [Escherichia phage T4]|uniref:DNA replication protein repEA n=3 Tax=Enterobacteria phage T4 TaxID=10665 RepID=REPEA_BPT4|nr:replication initiation protein [Escherichia phage T4]P32284.1 RecName: Full=DNA replication protein repEA; AltName: Full=DNA-binding protein dbpB [Tequatrovirus T4]ADJ39867.1 oriE replication initiation protein [Enterobacteria phage T4T]AAD42504.1 RepEA oriE replication initiation protein [Escherichia phage T4]AHY83689.1 oriE replication initiation protein [Tequatrovirus T4]AHY83877.1 oriE replication initiation protein [Tequatrovirus T4]AHY84070.1 oriE replication initiation protein [Tequ
MVILLHKFQLDELIYIVLAQGYHQIPEYVRFQFPLYAHKDIHLYMKKLVL